MSYRTFENTDAAASFCMQVREDGGTIFSTGRTETGRIGVHYSY